MYPPVEAFKQQKDEQRRSQKKEVLPDYTQLDLSKIYVILDWYNFAIVSLAQTKGFREDPDWIASRLKISRSEARSALRRLEQVGLLIRDPKGKLTFSTINFATPSDIPDFSIRKRHHQHLDLASESVDNHELFERDFSSITIATTRKKLKEAKRKIKHFRRDLCSFLESDEKEDVFLLNIQLFPLTKKEG